MTLVAGADLQSANPSESLHRDREPDDRDAASYGVVVYSQSAPIRLAAGGDVI